MQGGCVAYFWRGDCLSVETGKCHFVFWYLLDMNDHQRRSRFRQIKLGVLMANHEAACTIGYDQPVQVSCVRSSPEYAFILCAAGLQRLFIATRVLLYWCYTGSSHCVFVVAFGLMAALLKIMARDRALA